MPGSAPPGGFAPAGEPAAPSTPTPTPTPPPYVWPPGGPQPTWVGSEFAYLAYDLRTSRFLGQLPLRTVQFGANLDTPGQASGTLDLSDPRVQATDPINCTIPNRTLIAVDYHGAIVWAGIVLTRQRVRENDGKYTLVIQCSETWTYFQSRIQATDYSAPPSSGIVTPMALWTATPFDASLIASQIISDAIGYSDSTSEPYGDILGGLQLQLNGTTPTTPVAPSADWVAVNYPFSSVQTVDTIVTQLSQLGLGVGFDFGIDVQYTAGPGSPPIGTINLSYPRRGRTVAENNLMIDLTRARTYTFPEDGTQAASQVYEIGGSGALVVDVNVNPLDQGYPVWERVFSRANAQSAHIMQLLGQNGIADLAMYSYAPVAPQVTVGMFDATLPIGSFIVGDDVRLFLPAAAADSGPFDPGFPAGLDQEWRIVAYTATVSEQGDAQLQLTLNQPPYLQALAPAV